MLGEAIHMLGQREMLELAHSDPTHIRVLAALHICELWYGLTAEGATDIAKLWR